MTNSSKSQGLDGKVALITGAAGGIGGATAELFLELGAKVMLTDREGSTFHSGGANCASVTGDCADESAVRAAVAATVDRFGTLDIMIANAGTEGVLGPVDAMDRDEFERVLRTNVIGVWLAIKHAAAVMKSSGGGSIVALSSVAGAIGFPGMAAYTASKHAVFGLVKTAAIELGPAKVRVNAVAPGPVDNRMMQSLGDQLGGGDPHGFRSFVEGRVPMGRYGTNEEIANLIAFLSSDASSYCSGGLYLADGGYVAA